MFERRRIIIGCRAFFFIIYFCYFIIIITMEAFV